MSRSGMAEGFLWPRFMRRGFSVGCRGFWVSALVRSLSRRRGETYRGGRAGTPFGILHVHARPPGDLLKQECPLNAQLVELAAQAMQAQAGGVVVLFHLVIAVAQLTAFPAVGLLDGGREGLRDGVGWRHKRLRVSLRRLAGALGGHRGRVVGLSCLGVRIGWETRGARCARSMESVWRRWKSRMGAWNGLVMEDDAMVRSGLCSRPRSNKTCALTE